MKKLIEGIQRFKSGYFQAHRDLFEQLSHGQYPRILFITCSDSRIDPNLITQTDVGELFVIRNAGNIIPPYGAANGGEGASIEYAIAALNIQQVIVCAHSHCGAMKGLLKLNSLQEGMPLVYDWLKHAEATRRLVKENYPNLEGEELLAITTAENVLTQLENLQTYPVIRSRLHQGKMFLNGWIYQIETGEVLAYDPALHDFVPPQSVLTLPEPEYNLHPSCNIFGQNCFMEPHLDSNGNGKVPTATHASSGQHAVSTPSSLPGYDHLSLEQAERIYRGSR
ncbi:MAG: carbonic anhydrase [Snowella sp.]|nr:carbonic anhydrase [Snowella sp.]